jgi:hypothetical protein
MELTLAALVDLRLSPVQAIKIIRVEYAVSLSNTKRRLSLSPSWAVIAAVSVGI